MKNRERIELLHKIDRLIEFNKNMYFELLELKNFYEKHREKRRKMR